MSFFFQNQFFITIAGDNTVKNQLAEALYRRVLRAHGFVFCSYINA